METPIYHPLAVGCIVPASHNQHDGLNVGNMDTPPAVGLVSLTSTCHGLDAPCSDA